MCRADVLGSSVLGRRNSRCKDLVKVTDLTCGRNGTEGPVGLEKNEKQRRRRRQKGDA